MDIKPLLESPLTVPPNVPTFLRRRMVAKGVPSGATMYQGMKRGSILLVVFGWIFPLRLLALTEDKIHFARVWMAFFPGQPTNFEYNELRWRWNDTYRRVEAELGEFKFQVTDVHGPYPERMRGLRHDLVQIGIDETL